MFSFFLLFLTQPPSRLPSRPPPHCVGVRKEALRDMKSVFRKLRVKPSQQSRTVLLSWRKQTLILEKEMKEKEVVLRQRLVGSFAVSGFCLVIGTRWRQVIGSRVEGISKSGMPCYALGISMLCKTSCIPSCCSLGIGDGDVCSFLFWFGFDSSEQRV